MVNYFIMFFGIVIVLVCAIVIFIDKVKGEDIYFDLDFKEQELKKAIEDADEIITELNYTSDTIVRDLEDKINYLNSLVHKIEPSSTDRHIFDNQNNNKNSKIANNTDANKKYKLEGKDDFNNYKSDRIAFDKNSLVLKYFDEGYSISEIAQKMKIGKGEVQLITSLKNEDKKDGEI